MFIFTIGDIIGLTIWGLFLTALLLGWGASKVEKWRGKRK